MKYAPRRALKKIVISDWTLQSYVLIAWTPPSAGMMRPSLLALNDHDGVGMKLAARGGIDQRG